MVAVAHMLSWLMHQSPYGLLQPSACYTVQVRCDQFHSASLLFNVFCGGAKHVLAMPCVEADKFGLKPLFIDACSPAGNAKIVSDD